MYKHDKSSLIC